MKKILIVEGNPAEENQQFTTAGIQTHTESLKDSLAYFTNELKIDVVNPSSDQNNFKKLGRILLSIRQRNVFFEHQRCHVFHYLDIQGEGLAPL